MRKNNNKGITLVALIVTIIVLLVLATVTILEIKGNGIINKAKDAKTKYEEARINEQLTLLENECIIKPMNIEKAQTDILLYKKENSIIFDTYGNKVVLPAGFKTTSDANNVIQGVVITDGINEFVWIPVGDIKTNNGIINIGLNRYVFADGINDKDENQNVLVAGTPISKGNQAFGGSNAHPEHNCQEFENPTNPITNAVAIDINAFIQSANINGGYYIGRYKAKSIENVNRTSTSGNTSEMVCNNTGVVYNYVTQPQASELSKNMYKNSTTFTSDLVNSYAYDTTILFIQKCSQNCNYSNQITNDVNVCNIKDFPGSSTGEWTTEHNLGWGCVQRGSPVGYRISRFSERIAFNNTFMSSLVSFRPILYIK